LPTITILKDKIIKSLSKKFLWYPQLIFIWLGILLPPAIYFYFVYTYSLNLPFADDFTNLDQAKRIIESTNFSEQFSIFFVLENGHRIAFTRFIYTITFFLLGEIDFRLLIVLGNIPLVALLYLFFRTLKVSHTNLLYFVPVSILLFQLQSWKNMTWAASALQHQYILLFTGLTFYFLSKNSNRGFYCAFFFAVISIFTHAGGLVTIFLGWATLVISKRYRQSSIWVLGTFILGFFYLKNFEAGVNVFSGTQSLAGFKNLLTYFFAYLGSAISFENMHVAVGLGMIL